MIRIRMLWVVASLLSGTSIAYADTDSLSLVKVMRLDFATLDSTLWSIRRSVESGEIGSAVHDCLLKHDHSIFTPLWEKEVALRLTPKEISAALKFYSTPAGRKYTQYGLTHSHNEFLGKVAEEYPVLSKSDERAIMRFGDSPVGKKLLSGVLSEPYPEAVEALQKQIIVTCSK